MAGSLSILPLWSAHPGGTSGASPFLLVMKYCRGKLSPIVLGFRVFARVVSKIRFPMMVMKSTKWLVVMRCW